MKIAGAVHLVIWVLDVVAGNGHANDARRPDESSPSHDVATDKTSKATQDEKEQIMRYSTFEMAMKICPRHDDNVHTYNFTIKGVCAGFRCVRSDEGNTDEVFIQPEACPRRESPCTVYDRNRLLEFPRCCPSDCGVDRVKRKKRAVPVIAGLLVGLKVLMAAAGRLLIRQSLKFAIKQLGQLLIRQSLKNIKSFALNAITNTVKANMRGAVREVIKKTVNKAVTSYKKRMDLIKKGIKKRQKTGNEKNKKVGKGKKKEKKQRRKKKKESCECDYSASVTIEKGNSSEEEDSQGKEEDEDDEDEEEQSCELEEGDDGEDQCVGEDDNKDKDSEDGEDPEEQFRALYDAE